MSMDCEFCQMWHSSSSCFHPGQVIVRQLKAELAKAQEAKDICLGAAAFAGKQMEKAEARLQKEIAETTKVIDERNTTFEHLETLIGKHKTLITVCREVAKAIRLCRSKAQNEHPLLEAMDAQAEALEKAII